VGKISQAKRWRLNLRTGVVFIKHSAVLVLVKMTVVLVKMTGLFWHKIVVNGVEILMVLINVFFILYLQYASFIIFCHA